MKELNFEHRPTNLPDTCPIDFEVRSKRSDELLATVWGDEKDDLEVDCEHPEDYIEYDDDETVGECLLCGATCDWHWVNDFDGSVKYQYREPHEWHSDKVGGIIKEFLDKEYK